MFASISNLFAKRDVDGAENNSPTLSPSDKEQRRDSERSQNSASSDNSGFRPTPGYGRGMSSRRLQPVNLDCDNLDDSHRSASTGGSSKSTAGASLLGEGPKTPMTPILQRQDSPEQDNNWRQGSRSSFVRQDTTVRPLMQQQSQQFQSQQSRRSFSRSNTVAVDRQMSKSSILGAAPPAPLPVADSQPSLLGCGNEYQAKIERKLTSQRSILGEAQAATESLLGQGPKSFAKQTSTTSILGAMPAHQESRTSILGDGSPEGQDTVGELPASGRKQPLLRFRRTDTPMPKDALKQNARAPTHPPLSRSSSARLQRTNTPPPAGLLSEPRSYSNLMSNSLPYSGQVDGGLMPTPGLIGAPPGLSQIHEEEPKVLNLESLVGPGPDWGAMHEEHKRAGMVAPAPVRTTSVARPKLAAAGLKSLDSAIAQIEDREGKLFQAQGPDATRGFRLRRTYSNFSAISEERVQVA